MTDSEVADLTVVGVELEGVLVPDGLEVLREADLVAGWPRHLDLVDIPDSSDVVELSALEDVEAVLDERSEGERVVLLATGDPLFYGLGRWLNERVPGDAIRYIPGRSSVQLAFASLKHDYNEAIVHSLHGRPMDSLRSVLTRQPPAIALFTEPEGNTPSTIEEFLRKIDCDSYRMFLCERLGEDRTDPVEIEGPEEIPESVDPLNMVVLIRKSSESISEDPRPGLDSERFTTGEDSMVSDSYVRWLNVSMLQVTGDPVVWEIGAATGSISIESARLNPDARYYAVEKEADRFRTLRQNIRDHETYNVIPVKGEAPDVCEDWPDPDRVMIGGSGGRIEAILETTCDRLVPGGILLANFITMENFEATRDVLRDRGWDVNLLQFSYREDRRIAGRYTRWDDGPSFRMIRAVKPDD